MQNQSTKIFKLLTIILPFAILANVGLKIDEVKDMIPLFTIILGLFGMLIGFAGHHFSESKKIIIKIAVLIGVLVFSIGISVVGFLLFI
jgi:ATP/ADP translocase